MSLGAVLVGRRIEYAGLRVPGEEAVDGSEGRAGKRGMGGEEDEGEKEDEVPGLVTRLVEGQTGRTRGLTE